MSVAQTIENIFVFETLHRMIGILILNDEAGKRMKLSLFEF